MSDKYVRSFYDEVCQNLDGEYKIILEPPRDIDEEWIEYDTVKWEMEEGIKSLVDELLPNKGLSLEEKILQVYEYICLNYIYDTNVLYFFRKDDSDPENVKYIAADFYARVVGPEWAEKRTAHNRRICYEFARFYAKAINVLIDGEEDLEAFMLGDRDNNHYVVGLSGDKYSLILDQDDFNNIKDLTRLKLGLSIRGIRIFRDEEGIFAKALDKYNKGRLTELPAIIEAKEKYMKEDFIKYLNVCIDALSKNDIDPQGISEYVKYLVESEEIDTSKIWKLDKLNPEKRYERCLYFEYDGTTYLLDSLDKTLTAVNLNTLDKELFVLEEEKTPYEYFGG